MPISSPPTPIQTRLTPTLEGQEGSGGKDAGVFTRREDDAQDSKGKRHRPEHANQKNPDARAPIHESGFDAFGRGCQAQLVLAAFIW